MIDQWAVNRARFKKWFAWHAFEKQHLSSASCIHALGESEIDGIRRRGIQTPICVIPNGIDIPPAGRELPLPRKSTNRLQLLFLGRLHPKKGISELLAAWQKWQKEDTHFAGDWELLLAGWGETSDIAAFKRKVHEFGIDQTVKFSGPVFDQDKADLLKAATAFVLPSFSEGLPMAVLEAWAYGLPVLITPHCNLRQGIVEGAAISINPSADSIREGLAALARLSDSERSAMGLNGYWLVMRSYSWPTVAAQMKEVYDWSIGGGQAPASVVTD
jgi:poly(glycerol-phosphate) alpha-glucosyltransferase